MSAHTGTILSDAMTAYNQGNYEAALHIIHAVKDHSPEALYVEIMSLIGKGEVEQAAAMLQREQPRFGISPLATALGKHAWGRIHLRQKQHAQALPLLNDARRELATNQACLLDYAECLFALGEALQAKQAFLSALAIGPGHADLFANIGVCAMHGQQYPEAIAYYSAAWALQPRADIAGTLGLLYLKCGDVSRAEDYFRRAIKLDDTNAEWWQGLGECHQLRRRYKRALQCFNQVLLLSREHVGLHMMMAHACQKLLRYHEAQAHYRRAIALAPDHMGIYTELANCHQQQLDYAKAHEILDSAEKQASGSKDIQYSRGFVQLLEGSWKEGWANYESRWQTSHLGERYRNVVNPLASLFWDGKASLDGKTVMALCEQGAGDIIQFSLYCQHLVNRGATVDLLAPPFMKEVMETMPWVRQVHCRYADIPPHDYHVSLMSMPLYEGTEVHTVPVASEPYLKAPYTRPPFSKKFTIGLCWAGDPKNPYDHLRSIPAPMLRPLLKAFPDIDFVSLQMAPLSHQARRLMKQGLMIDGLSHAQSFSDTAAAIAAVDGVISVCTAVAHLAGAMHKPTWLLLAKYADWRWLGDDDTKTAWYPTMRIFRQKKLGQWRAVLRDVITELKDAEYQG